MKSGTIVKKKELSRLFVALAELKDRTNVLEDLYVTLGAKSERDKLEEIWKRIDALLPERRKPQTA